MGSGHTVCHALNTLNSISSESQVDFLHLIGTPSSIHSVLIRPFRISVQYQVTNSEISLCCIKFAGRLPC